MVIIDFRKKNSFLAQHATIKVKDTNKIPGDEFIWYNTKERSGEIKLQDPRTGVQFTKKVYSVDLMAEFKIEKYELERLRREYGIPPRYDEMVLDIANKLIRVRIRTG